ncbi:MAG: DUF3747 domain-containing protein [Cyanobacteria bacterium P01_F01_bin.42]
MAALLPSSPLPQGLNMFNQVLRHSAAIALGLMAALPMAQAQAALFDQEEVEQDRFVVVAVPLPQGNRHNLLVIEQKSDARPCWEESGEAINPLLLTFDFTGVCGRSTDSNGYSIRQVGEDLALKYRLSLQKKNGVLVLTGVPLRSSFGKAMEIGKTQSAGGDFLRVTLNPDWRLTRRVYQGRPLGHIYFTRDVIPLEAESTSSPIEETDSDPVPTSGPDSLEDPGFSPTAPRPLDGPIQIPVPRPRSQTLTSQAPKSQAGQTASVPAADFSPPPMTPIPVPTIAPLGRVGASEPDVFSNRDLPRLPQVSPAGDPPPPPFNVALSIKRYRVFAAPENSTQSQALQNLAPDAFWTVHKGRRMLQLGAFLEKSKADTMIQALGDRGISGIIDASSY